MKERSINDLFNQYSLQKKGKTYFGTYEKIKQKYSQIPSLTNKGSSNIHQQQTQKLKTQVQKFNTKKQQSIESQRLNQLGTIIIDEKKLTQSIYLSDVDSKIKPDEPIEQAPPLVISTKKNTGQFVFIDNDYVSVEQSSLQPNFQRQQAQQNIFIEEEKGHDIPKNTKKFQQNKFIQITREVLSNISTDQFNYKLWTQQKRTPNLTLSSILVNDDKMNYFLKSSQEQCIQQFEKNKIAGIKISKNIEILSCLLQKIKNCERNGNGAINISLSDDGPKIKFTNSSNEALPKKMKDKTSNIKQLQKEIKNKDKFIENTKKQYDSIINNFGVSVINLMKEIYGENIPDLQKQKNNQEPEVSNIFEPFARPRIQSVPSSIKQASLKKKYTFGQRY